MTGRSLKSPPLKVSRREIPYDGIAAARRASCDRKPLIPSLLTSAELVQILRDDDDLISPGQQFVNGDSGDHAVWVAGVCQSGQQVCIKEDHSPSIR
jgi:hypothetical protein